MTLSERIQEQRKSHGISQEKLAELVGVSRQAVTKWETGQSAPGTENLFRLAEVFGVTVDLLLDTEEAEKQSPAEQLYYLYKLEEEKKAAQRRVQWKKNLRAVLLLAAAWAVIFALGALVLPGGWTSSEYALLGVVFRSYPFGWLVDNNLFWISAVVCVLPAWWGKRKFCAVGTVGFAAALLLGTLLGENPAGAAYGFGHYGWAIWGGVFVLSLVMGLVLERFWRGRLDPQDKKLWFWLAVLLVGVAVITALVALSMPRNFS